MAKRHLQLGFLGKFESILDNEPIVHFRSSKVQGLLIYLVLTTGQTHTRDELATLLWPDESEGTAKHNLRQSLFRLRKVLGETESSDPPFFLINRSTIQFNRASNYALDVDRFLAHLSDARFKLAVPLYQGELLPTFSCDSQLFDDWLQQIRTTLHQKMLDALSGLTDTCLAQAEFSEAQRYSRQQLSLDPWREEAHRQLMQALMLAGERTAALAQYDRCRSILAEELGVEPSPKTEQLAHQIRQSLIGSVARSKRRQLAGQQRLTMPFVGRQAEFKKLSTAYQQMLQDGFQVATVLGKAGIGKTRLSDQFTAWAGAQGANVLFGRAFETSAGLSYQPLIDLFRQRLEQVNAPEDLLSDFWLAQLTRLLPELRDRYPDLPPSTQDETLAKQHLFEAVTRLGQALANRGPLVLFIEDWHWADSASLDLLQYAAAHWSKGANQLEGVSMLLLLTFRQEAITTEIQSWLTRFLRNVSNLKIELSELSQSETLSLLETLLAPEEEGADTKLARFNEWLFDETEGQPLFIAETLKVLADDQLIQPIDSKLGWRID
ncbi:MAG: AAA family ATPase, partial [Chloroflexota bacterium]